MLSPLFLARVIEVPQFGALVFGVPVVRCCAEGEDALFGAAFLFIAPSAAKGGIKTASVERGFQSVGKHQLRVNRCRAVDRINALCRCLGIVVDNEIKTIFRGLPVAQFEQVPEIPPARDMKEGKGRGRRIKGLQRDVEHHRRILANRIEEHRTLCLGHNFAHDVDGFGFKPFEMGQFTRHDGFNWPSRAEVQEVMTWM